MVGTAALSPCPLPRHSRFGGSYVLQGLKSIGDRDVVFHKGLHNVSVGPGRWRGAEGQGGGRGAWGQEWVWNVGLWRRMEGQGRGGRCRDVARGTGPGMW